MERARCKGMDPGYFFPETGAPDPYWQARIVCGSCPVRRVCLSEAMREESRSYGGRHGMRGGKSPNERRELARRAS